MAKYSLDTITVSEVLDVPELRALVDKHIPAVLEHPPFWRWAVPSSSTTPSPISRIW